MYSLLLKAHKSAIEKLNIINTMGFLKLLCQYSSSWRFKSEPTDKILVSNEMELMV